MLSNNTSFLEKVARTTLHPAKRQGTQIGWFMFTGSFHLPVSKSVLPSHFGPSLLYKVTPFAVAFLHMAEEKQRCSTLAHFSNGCSYKLDWEVGEDFSMVEDYLVKNKKADLSEVQKIMDEIKLNPPDKACWAKGIIVLKRI